MTIQSDQIFWILSRGAGITAITLASLSVSLGLLSGRSLKLGSFKIPEGKVVHEALSVATIIAVLTHGFLLLGDSWSHPGISGITIPFTMDYRPIWTGIGIISAYGLILLGLSYYVRGTIGPNRWRYLHRFTAVFWIGGLIHAIGAGTDIGDLWMWLVLAIPAIPAFVLLGMRMGGGGHSPATRSGRANPARSQGGQRVLPF
jgi:methionine sulfoxide reductase heme-binding subunit